MVSGGLPLVLSPDQVVVRGGYMANLFAGKVSGYDGKARAASNTEKISVI